MATAATTRFMDIWYARVDAEQLLAELTATTDKATVKAAQKGFAKARRKTSLGSLDKFATKVDDGWRIKQQPPVIVRPPAFMHAEAEQLVRDGLTDYALTLTPDRRLVLDHYHYEDFARKVVGVGSVGTEAFMVLLMGDLEDDPLFLQVKEATTSVLAPYAGASDYAHQGERVVQGQRITQSASDAFLGWVTGRGDQHREFYVRQLRDMKGSAAIELMPPERLARYGELCGVCSRARMRAPATPPRSPAISAKTMRSRARSNSSRSPTPIRTTPTTRPSPRPPTRSASPSRVACRSGRPRVVVRPPGLRQRGQALGDEVDAEDPIVSALSGCLLIPMGGSHRTRSASAVPQATGCAEWALAMGPVPESPRSNPVSGSYERASNGGLSA